jgi:hypothetical protein
MAQKLLADRKLPDRLTVSIQSGIKRTPKGMADAPEVWDKFLGGMRSDPKETWWRQHLDLPAYSSFHALNWLLGNVDLRPSWVVGSGCTPGFGWRSGWRPGWGAAAAAAARGRSARGVGQPRGKCDVHCAPSGSSDPCHRLRCLWFGGFVGIRRRHQRRSLFARHRDLLTDLDVVCFDTTSLCFEGGGGDDLGRYGHSKDHRPYEQQMVVGAVLDGAGRPICCALWPGNTTEVTTLLPVVDRLWRRFRIRQACVVADRGMLCQDTVTDLEEQGRPYILGARLRQAEVRDEVLAARGRFRVVHGPRQRADEPAPLKVKDVCVQGRRYVVCVHAEEVESDRARREAIVASLREQLTRGDKALVGNRGYRRYLKVEGAGHFAIDEAQLEAEARYDGTWVLRTNTDWPAAEVALRYKKLWLVEPWFRACKSLVETRPVYHQRDETIRGQVFCSLLALVLRHELQTRLEARGHNWEWAEVMEDLEHVQYVEVEQGGKRFRLRSELQATAGRVFQAAGVAAPPTVQQVTEA